MILPKRFIVIFLVILSASISSISSMLLGQNYTITNYTNKEGLANNAIRSLALDSTGFLWIGTFDGLSRFDGYEFRNYYHVPGDSTSISYFTIDKLTVDKKNNLWVQVPGGKINIYDRSNDCFQEIRYPPEAIPNSDFSREVDSDGNIWFFTKDKIARFNPICNSLKLYNLPDSKVLFEKANNSYCNNWDFSESSKIWLLGNNAVQLEISDNGEYSEIKLLGIYDIEYDTNMIKIDFETTSYFKVIIDRFNNYWLFTNRGYYKGDKETKKFIQFKGVLNPDDFPYNQSIIWSRYLEGISIVNVKKNKLNTISSNESNFVLAICRQNDRLVWFSSVSGDGTYEGLSKVIFTSEIFRNIIVPGKSGEVPSIFSISEDNEKNIWLGGRGLNGLWIYGGDGSSKHIGHLSASLTERLNHPRAMVRTFGGIWIGYFISLLRFYDFNDKSFKDFLPGEKSYRTIAAEKGGKLLVGNIDLNLYDPVSNKTTLLWKSPNKQIFYKLLKINDSIIWCGKSTNYLLRYNLMNGKGTEYSILKEPYHIEDILVGKDGNLWLATLGAGVIKFHPSTGKYKMFTTSAGLSNNTTYSLLLDNNQKIWVSTDDGLSRIDPVNEKIKVFKLKDGVKIMEFNSDAVYKSEDGRLYFGGVGGIVSFYPDSINETDEDYMGSRILLTELTVSGNTKHLNKPLNETDTLILPAGENNFHLTFSTTDYINNQDIRYRYRLLPNSKSWNITSSGNRNANFSELSPGWYRFELNATDFTGNWNIKKQLAIRIKPYYHQTLLFKSTVITLITGIVLLIIILYIRQIKTKGKQKQDDLRLKALQGQMNPHFIFNSLNSINYFISNNDKLSANRYIADFSRLIRSILTNMGTDYVSLESELNSITNYLNIEHLRFGEKFDFRLMSPSINQGSCIEIFPGLIQPFVENAIWHGMRPLEGRRGLIVISFMDPDPHKIKCIIEDDGVGRVIAQGQNHCLGSHNSKGISIVKERLQIMGNLRRMTFRIDIMDLYPERNETGTRVVIEIPIRNSKSLELPRGKS